MILTSSTRKKRRGSGKVLALVGVLAGGAIAFGAYKLFFARPGEAAIQLIPADATVVVTLDTNPSEAQLPAFTKIYQSLEREGIASKIDEAISGMFNKSELGKKIRPNVATSFAYAYFAKQSHYAMLTAVKDVNKVSEALNSGAKKVADEPPTFKVDEINQFAAVIGGYLVMSDDQGMIAEISGLQDAKGASLASLPEYQQARKGLPEDANLMVFVSPEGLKEIQKNVPGGNIDVAQWIALGATIRDDGIAFDFRGPINMASSPALKAMASIKPLDTDVLKKYPEGAYGLVAYSQPSQYWAPLEAEIKKGNDSTSFYRGLEQFERETGLSVENDILPAFQGDLSVAVYPGPTGKPEDLDMVLMADDANGANPAALVAKVRTLIERKSSENGETVRFEETTIGGATVWELDSESRRKMIDGMKGSSSSGPVLDGKTIIFAQVGNGIAVATSRGLLNNVLSASEGGKSLSSDPAFTGMMSRMADGSQCAMMISLRRILETMRPMLEEQMKSAPFTADDVITLFGGMNTGLVGSGRMDGDLTVGTLFLPLDFEKAIHLVGEGMRSSSQPSFEEPPTDSSFGMREGEGK